MTLEELQEIAQTELEKQLSFKHHVNVCVAAGCLSCQSDAVRDSLQKEVLRRGIESTTQVKGVGCLGLCTAGPLLSVDDKTLYQGVTAQTHPINALGGSPVDAWTVQSRCHC